MNIRESADLGAAFETLKNDLRKAEELKSTYENSGEGYAAAYGRLRGSVQAFIFLNTTITSMREVMEDSPGTAANDIPGDLFTSSGAKTDN